MASSVNLVKKSNNSDKLLVEGCASSRAPSSAMSHVMDHTLTPEVRNKVFGNHLIKDIIFDYVFTGSDGKLPIKDILTCRQVDKTWLEYVSFRLQKTGSPQFNIYFHSGKSIRGKEDKFGKFLDTWTNVNYPDAGSLIPLFNLIFVVSTADKNYKDELHALKNILTQCANGLHSLKVFAMDFNHLKKDYSLHESFLSCIGEILLPKLQDLELSPIGGEIGISIVNTLLRTILSGCKQLKSLYVYPIHTDGSKEWFSKNDSKLCATVKLPDTLVKIKFDTEMTTQQLENLLLANSLPNLTTLQLTIPMVGDENDVIIQILHRFRLQLQHFTLLVSQGSDQLPNISFPVMPKLKYMSVSSTHYKTLAGAEHFQPFPSLETLNLTDQTSSTLASWIQNLNFKSVKSLALCPRSSNNINETIFTLEVSRQLPNSFSFLQELAIAFGTFQDYSIRNIFQQMVSLRKLSMAITYTEEITDAATWDAILVGVTPDYAVTLASTRDQWDSISLNDHRVPSHSIINLTQLESLTLLAKNPEDSVELIISDVSFRFAFLCMPKLHELKLMGKFGASSEFTTVNFYIYVHGEFKNKGMNWFIGFLYS